jgi:N-dimethylarginine dimethylaminohydrolase
MTKAQISKIPPAEPGARILMCPPDHFAVDYAINPWMDPKDWAQKSRSLGLRARREWQGLRRRILALGATIEEVPAVAELPDLVFTANAAVVMDGVALVARFRHPERQREEHYFERGFRKLWARGILAGVRMLPEGLLLEGAGDCVWDKTRQMFWMGYGPRSQREAARAVSDTFGLETVALELVDPRFYHMDTAISALPHGEIMYVPSAFNDEGLKQIRDRTNSDQRIELNPEDAALFVANAVHLGNDIILSGCSDGLRARLEEAGYRVHPTPLGAFHKSGGSAFCLTLRLDHRSERGALGQRQVS